MSKKEIQKQHCLERLTAHVLETGLAQTSLRQLAKAAGVSDRMLLYYFDNKSDVMAQTLLSAAGAMAVELNQVVPADPKLQMGTLLERGITLTQSEAMEPYMSLSLQIAAKAHQGLEPYLSSAKLIISGFIAWIEARLETDDPKQRRKQAIFILAVIDGFGVLSVGLDKGELMDISSAVLNSD